MSEEKFSILIADDEEGLRFSLAMILELEGYSVKTAQDGNEALALAQQNDFDIAFFDIRMPGINGVDAFKKMKVISPETIVVMMTAYAMNDLIKESISEGAFACISKPFEIDDVLRTVKEVKEKPTVLTLTDPATVDFLKAALPPSGYLVISENNAEKAKKFIKRRNPAVVFLDDTEANISLAEGVSGTENKPEIVVLSNDKLSIGDFKVIKKPLTKNLISEFLKANHKKKIAIVWDDTISSNNLKLSMVANGFEVTYFPSEERFLKDSVHANFEFVIADTSTVADYEEFYEKVNAADSVQKIVFLSDYDNVISENLKNDKAFFFQKTFDLNEILGVLNK